MKNFEISDEELDVVTGGLSDGAKIAINTGAGAAGAFALALATTVATGGATLPLYIALSAVFCGGGFAGTITGKVLCDQKNKFKSPKSDGPRPEVDLASLDLHGPVL